MSILFINSSSRVSGGVIKSFAKSGQYTSIVCADLYPNYHGINRYLNLKESIGNTATKVTDVKIQGKTSLEKAISEADKVVYITHDYYSMVPSKLNLIKSVANIAKSHKTQLVCVTPAEYDHFGEKDPITSAVKSEQEALEANPDTTIIRSDLTFGPDSQVIEKTLFTRIANGISLYLQTPVTANFRPVNHALLVDSIKTVLSNPTGFKGNAYYLSGPDILSLNEIIQILESSVGKKAVLNQSTMDKLFKPTSDCVIGDHFNGPCKKNCSRLINGHNWNASTWGQGNYKDAVQNNLTSLENTTLVSHYSEGAFAGKDVAAESTCRFRKFLFD